MAEAAGSQQKGAALAFGKLVKETAHRQIFMAISVVKLEHDGTSSIPQVPEWSWNCEAIDLYVGFMMFMTLLYYKIMGFAGHPSKNMGNYNACHLSQRPRMAMELL